LALPLRLQPGKLRRDKFRALVRRSNPVLGHLHRVSLFGPDLYLRDVSIR